MVVKYCPKVQKVQKKGEVDAINDADLIWFDHDSVNDRSQDLATRSPVGLVKVVVNRPREVIETFQGSAECRLPACLRLHRILLCLQVRLSSSRPFNS